MIASYKINDTTTFQKVDRGLLKVESATLKKIRLQLLDFFYATFTDCRVMAIALPRSLLESVR